MNLKQTRIKMINDLKIQLAIVEENIKGYYDSLPLDQEIVYSDDHTLNGLNLLKAMLLAKLNQLESVNLKYKTIEFTVDTYTLGKEKIMSLGKLIADVSVLVARKVKTNSKLFVRSLSNIGKTIVTSIKETFNSVMSTISGWFGNSNLAY